MPPDVAALVDRVTADGVSVQLVNLHPTEAREVILQAGAFGEHRFTAIRQQHDSTDVNGKLVHVRLRPGARGRLEIGMVRYAQRPTYARPWQVDGSPTTIATCSPAASGQLDPKSR